MNTDYLPSSDNQFVNMLQNLGTRLTPLAVSLGLTAADAAAVTTDATSLRALVLDQDDKKNAAKAATAAKDTGRQAIEKRTRLLVKRIKANPGYTPAIGQQLGVVSASAAGVLALTNSQSMDDRPTLRASVTGDGTVVLKFAKGAYTGALVYSRRSGEAEFVLLAKQFRSPLIDTRDNLGAGRPETREYMAQYVEGDSPVGQMSDIVAVTVPGVRTVADRSAEPALAVALAKAA